MTEQEMTQETLDFWRREYPEKFKTIPKEGAMRQARARASLTRMEMDALKLVNPNLTDEMAWSESRHLFCMKSPETDGEEVVLDPETEDAFKSLWGNRGRNLPPHLQDLDNRLKQLKRRQEAERSETASEAE